MPIKVTCSCGQSFKAKDELAGKKARCPKCSQPLLIPTIEADELRLEAALDAPKYNPLDDILSEEGIKPAHTGPVCPSCKEPVNPSAILCVQCGFNLETGEQVMVSDDDDEDLETAGMSETDKMIWKAEQEIQEMPLTAEGEKFGDEGDSYAIAIVMGIVMVALVGLSVFTIIQLDQIQEFNTTLVSGWMSFVFVVGAVVSITITAFKERAREGYLCLTIVYTEWYAVTRGLYVQLGILNLFAIIAYGCYYTLTSS